MTYVFFGGMRGTAWVNTFQTTLFLRFGTISFVVIGWGMGGFSGRGRGDPAPRPGAPAHLRAHVAALFLSYTFIPLSSIAFPAHHDLLPHRAQDEPVQAHRDPLPAVHRGAVAALRPPGGDGEPRHRRAEGDREDRGARRRWPPMPGRSPRRSATRCAPRRAATTCCCCCSSATRRSGSRACWAPASWRR